MFLWMELHLVSLKGNAMSNSESLSVYGFGMALGSLSASVIFSCFAEGLAWGIEALSFAGIRVSLILVLR